MTAVCCDQLQAPACAISGNIFCPEATKCWACMLRQNAKIFVLTQGAYLRSRQASVETGQPSKHITESGALLALSAVRDRSIKCVLTQDVHLASRRARLWKANLSSSSWWAAGIYVLNQAPVDDHGRQTVHRPKSTTCAC